MVHTILMVDDDTNLLMFVKEFLESHGFCVRTAESGAEAVRMIHTEPKLYSVIVLDYQMEGLNGAATTKALLAVNPKLPIVIYSGDTSREAVLRSTRSGAFTFVDKDESPTVFLEEVRRAAARYENEGITLDHSDAGTEQAIFGMVGKSRALQVIAQNIAKLRDKPGPVLILGESGTGKELVAQALHGSRKGIFRAVNCADYLMSTGTARSELFGHTKGAFTGADQDRAGVFEQAKDGTVFLDEIYSLPPEAQVGLLRVLQEQKLIRMGGSVEVPLTSRLISAAKPDLVHDIAKRTFKADLFYRISQNIIEVPPLHERTEDIELLVQHFCSKWAEENGEQKTFLIGAVERLKEYRWPGNIRELENVVYSVLNTTNRKEIRAEDLGARFRRSDISAANGPMVREAAIEREKAKLVEAVTQSKSIREAAVKLGTSHQTVMRRLEKYSVDWRNLLGTEAASPAKNKRKGSRK